MNIMLGESHCINDIHNVVNYCDRPSDIGLIEILTKIVYVP